MERSAGKKRKSLKVRVRENLESDGAKAIYSGVLFILVVLAIVYFSDNKFAVGLAKVAWPIAFVLRLIFR
jgi:hypothetical protein